MLANIRKSQADGWLWGVTYSLYAELELTPEERHIIDRAGLASRVIFDSENTEYYGNATVESAKSMGYTEHTGDVWVNIGASFYSTIWHLGATAYNAVQWSFSLQLTIQSLLDGCNVDSENHEEILLVENLINDAVHALQSHVVALADFEGQDNLIEPE